uniref:Uncharacterized protein n=1 Tax=Strigamia maritima TaxID=126957 RepID=T1IJP4_STRMM
MGFHVFTRVHTGPHEFPRGVANWDSTRFRWRYYYEVSKNMNCDYFQPFTPLYANQTLIGFSTIAFGIFSSPHYNEADEHIPEKDFPKFIEVVPTCLKDVPEGFVTTLHVYLIV